MRMVRIHFLRRLRKFTKDFDFQSEKLPRNLSEVSNFAVELRLVGKKGFRAGEEGDRANKNPSAEVERG
jgi:hypothetical protein